MGQAPLDLLAAIAAALVVALSAAWRYSTGEWLVDQELTQGLSAFAVAALMRHRYERRRGRTDAGPDPR